MRPGGLTFNAAQTTLKLIVLVIHQFPTVNPIPQHIAVIMDGNRRWAQQRTLPVAMGHASGARRVRGLVKGCVDRGVKFLTLFAFSTENWKRPEDEVSGLMGLLSLYLKKEVSDAPLSYENFRD